MSQEELSKPPEYDAIEEEVLPFAANLMIRTAAGMPNMASVTPTISPRQTSKATLDRSNHFDTHYDTERISDVFRD